MKVTQFEGVQNLFHIIDEKGNDHDHHHCHHLRQSHFPAQAHHV